MEDILAFFSAQSQRYSIQHLPFIQEFTSEPDFVDLLESSHNPIALYYEVGGCALCTQNRSAFLSAAKEFHPQIRFIRVNCSNNEEFCAKRKLAQFPTTELFYFATQKNPNNPDQSKVIVQVDRFDFHPSLFGYSQFFIKSGVISRRVFPNLPNENSDSSFLKGLSRL